MTDIKRLLEIMRRLRDPEAGCPWDQEQTFETIAPYTLEEAYEVADAIARGDLAELPGELGDLLFQVVYHARMAEEQGAFDFADVVTLICDKLVRRHPHVFGNEATPKPGDWERQKVTERGAQTRVLDGIARSLPALRRAAKLQNRAAAVGFDWPEIAPVFAKVREEVDEVCVELSKQEISRDATTAELGDLLFAIVNLCRHLDIDAEFALMTANDRFCDRFGYIEDRLAEDGRKPAGAALDELDRLWNEAKNRKR